MDLFSISMALAKSAVKQMAKEQIKNIAVDAVRKSIPRKIVEDQFVFYKSSRTVESMLRHHEDVAKAFVNLGKMSREQNFSSLDRTFKSFNSFGERVERIRANDMKQAIRENRSFNFNDQDLDIFMRSQFNKDKGSISIKDLASSPQIYESCPFKYTIGDHVYYNIDRIISQNIKDGKVDIEQLKKASGKDYFEKINDRLEQLRELNLIGNSKDPLIVSQTYSNAVNQLRSSFNHMDYKIYKSVTEHGNFDALQASFKRPMDSFDFQERLDILKQEGFLKVEEGQFKVTEAFTQSHEKYVSFLKENAENFLSKKYSYFEKMGLVNQRSNDLYEMTDLYYKSFQEISIAKNYIPSYFDDRLINSIADHEPLSQVKQNFMEGNFDEDYMNMRFAESLKSLSEKGIVRIDVENDSIQLINHVKTNESQINFAFYDVNLYRKFSEGKLNLSDFENLNVTERKRIANHLHHGLIDIKDGALNITEEGNAVLSDFLKGVKISQAVDNFKLDKVTEYLATKGSFTINDMIKDEFLQRSFDYLKNRVKPFEFGKYDANVILKHFATPISKEQYSDILKASLKADVFEKELAMRMSRVGKLLENGYLRYGEDNLYHITELGQQGIKDLSGFAFTEYDSNVLFKWIRDHGGKIDKDGVRESLSSLYKDKDLENQLNYNLKRLNSNVELGTVKFDGSHFSITEKGVALEQNMISNKMQHVEKGLKSKLEYLEYLGFVEQKEGIYSFTPRYDQFINIREMKLSNLDLNIYKKLTADGPFNINAEKESLISRYNEKNAQRQFRVLSGRLEKLDQMGLVYHDKGVYKATDKFHSLIKDHERFKHLDDPKSAKLEVQNEFKMQGIINSFTFNNVTDVLGENDRLWTKEKYLAKINDPSSLARTEKHLEKLSQTGYALKTDEGYLLHDEIFERSQLLSLDKDRRFTQKQIDFLVDLRDFQSLSQTQANKYIFGNQNIGDYSLNELVKKGIIDFKIKNIDGNHERIYYLEKRGKKALVALTGDEKQVFDSKILSRPQEVKHDLYVYSAYKDFEEYLKAENMRIVDVKTDKDIRSLINSGKLENSVSGSHKTAIKVEFADLYIEYESLETLERGYVNIEVDVGYTKDVIASKANSIDNLMWYTDSASQMTKIQSVQKNAIVKVINL